MAINTMRSILITFALILMASACLSADTPTPTMTATDTPTETPTPFLLEDPYLEFYLKYSDFEPGIRYLIPQQFEVTPLPTKTPTVGEGTPTNTPHPPTATKTATPTPTPTLTPMDPSSCEYHASHACDGKNELAFQFGSPPADGQILMVSKVGTAIINTDFPTYPPFPTFPPTNTPTNTATDTQTPTRTSTPTITPTITPTLTPIPIGDYVKRDGSTPLTANWDAGNYDITFNKFISKANSNFYCDLDASTGLVLAYNLEIGAGSTSDNDTLYFDGRAAYIIWRNADSRFDVTHKWTAPSFDSGLFRAGSVSSGSTAYPNTFFSADSNGDGFFSFLMSPSVGEHGITWSTGTSGGAIYDAYLSYTAADDTLRISANNDGTGTYRTLRIGADGFFLVNCDTGNGTPLVIDGSNEILIANTPTATQTPTVTQTPTNTATPTNTPAHGFPICFQNDRDVAADAYLYIGNWQSSATYGYPMPYAGSITSIWVCATYGTYTAGDRTDFECRKNNSNVFELRLTPAGTGVICGTITQAVGTDTFAANDIISAYVDNQGTLSTITNISMVIGVTWQ